MEKMFNILVNHNIQCILKCAAVTGMKKFKFIKLSDYIFKIIIQKKELKQYF